MSLRMVEAMGGAPTPIDWGELYTSLQQGVVDGAENNPPSFYLSHHYEICKYYILDEHARPPDERRDEQRRGSLVQIRAAPHLLQSSFPENRDRVSVGGRF